VEPRYFTPWTQDIERNRLLFWAIVICFLTVSPTRYLPVVNRVLSNMKVSPRNWPLYSLSQYWVSPTAKRGSRQERVHLYVHKTVVQTGSRGDDLEKSAFHKFTLQSEDRVG
jgi:hypothetical protein